MATIRRAPPPSTRDVMAELVAGDGDPTSRASEQRLAALVERLEQRISDQERELAALRAAQRAPAAPAPNPHPGEHPSATVALIQGQSAIMAALLERALAPAPPPPPVPNPAPAAAAAQAQAEAMLELGLARMLAEERANSRKFLGELLEGALNSEAVTAAVEIVGSWLGFGAPEPEKTEQSQDVAAAAPKASSAAEQVDQAAAAVLAQRGAAGAAGAGAHGTGAPTVADLVGLWDQWQAGEIDLTDAQGAELEAALAAAGVRVQDAG